MKYIQIVILIVLINTLSFTQPKLEVLASASMISDIALNVGGDKVNIETIVPIGGDPHIYESTPKDAKLCKNADVILINGLTFEGWIQKMINNSGTEAAVVTVTKGAQVYSSLEYEDSADPHAWMDAANGIIYAKNILDALILKDPENESYYTNNFNIYKKKLIDLDHYIQTEINKIPKEQRILITSHDAFQYYGKKYGLQLEATMGISTEAEVRTSDVARVSKFIRENKIPAIFIESTINPKLIQRIAQDTGAKIGGELYADSLGDENSSASTYINMLKSNTTTIVNALAFNTIEETKIDKQGPNSHLIWYVLIGLIMILILLFLIKFLNK